MGRPKGCQKFGGRQKGTLNKKSKNIVKAILETADFLNNIPISETEKVSLHEWARANPGEFWTKVWTKLLPRDINIEQFLNVEGSLTVNNLIEAKQKFLESEGFVDIISIPNESK